MPFGKARKRWRSVFENSAYRRALTDLNRRFLATNHVFQAMVGYTEEELRAVNFLDLTHEDYRQANWTLHHRVGRGKATPVSDREKVSPQGRQFDLGKQQRFSCAGHRRVPRIHNGAVRGLTQRKRAEELYSGVRVI